MTSRSLRFVILSLLVAAGCGKKDDGGPAPADDKAEAKKPHKHEGEGQGMRPHGPDAPWKYDPAAIQAKLQGAWLLHDVSMLGKPEAWKVDGDQVTVYDGTTEVTGTLTVDAPCQLTIMQKNPDGSSEGGTDHFVFDGDKLTIGLGDAGLKLDGKVLACAGNGVYLVDGATCKFYNKSFDRWSGEDGTCAVAGDKLTVGNKTFNASSELAAAGELFMSDQFKKNAAVKAASYEEAKKTVDAAKKN